VAAFITDVFDDSKSPVQLTWQIRLHQGAEFPYRATVPQPFEGHFPSPKLHRTRFQKLKGEIITLVLRARQKLVGIFEAQIREDASGTLFALNCFSPFRTHAPTPVLRCIASVSAQRPASGF
jgi:hypothetical protein